MNCISINITSGNLLYYIRSELLPRKTKDNEDTVANIGSQRSVQGELMVMIQSRACSIIIISLKLSIIEML